MKTIGYRRIYMTQYKKAEEVTYDGIVWQLLWPGSSLLWLESLMRIKMLATNPYEKYDAYNEKTKLYGELQHDSQKEEDVYYLSVHYPEYQEKVMNDLVANYRKKHVKVDKSIAACNILWWIMTVNCYMTVISH